MTHLIAVKHLQSAADVFANAKLVKHRIANAKPKTPTSITTVRSVWAKPFDPKALRRPVKPMAIVAPSMPQHNAHVLAYGTHIAQITMHPFERMLIEVAEKHGITVADLKGLSRCHRISRPRHEAMYRGVVDLKMSTPQIGRRLGGRDYTTVRHGSRAHARRMEAALCER